MFATGLSPCPIERTLLTTGLVAAGVESLHRGEIVATPELLSIQYFPPVESTYMGAPEPSHGNLLPLPPTELHPPSALAVHGRRLRIAVIGSIWGYSSHVDHISNRFLSGYPMNGDWHRPEMDVVSAWIHQTDAVNDISSHRAEQFGFKLYGSIREAMCCGGDDLAVDCVLLIAEHGEYPTNFLGQKLYPRHTWFHEILTVLESAKKALPIYCDKHLSYSFVEAERMVSRAYRLGIPLLADSGIPFSWRLPELELPIGCVIEEAIMVGCGGIDAHAFQALASMQALLERRDGGETGVASVRAVRGANVWEEGKAGVWSEQLLEAALSCADEVQGQTTIDARPQDLLRSGALASLAAERGVQSGAVGSVAPEGPGPVALIIERLDGLRATYLHANGAVGDFLFAARIQPSLGEPSRLVATTMLRSPGPCVHYSACLAANIEQMFVSGAPPYPVERTLLVGGILEQGLRSLAAEGNPTMDCMHSLARVQYKLSGPESFHTRA